MNKIIPWPEQYANAERGLQILREHGLVYLAMEERTGKSLTALLICEDTGPTIKNVLIITKKGKPLDGWNELLANYVHLCSYTVINYHSVHKVTNTKYDLIILDEAHSYISGYPKTSKLWLTISRVCKDKPIIYISATPKAQGIQLLYHQLKLSSWSPWKRFNNFYDWFKEYALRDKHGQLPVTYIGGSQTALDYSKTDHDKGWNEVKHLFISMTREELGFEHEPEDVLHYIELNETTKNVYNHLLKHKSLVFDHIETNCEYTIICDTPMKLRTTLHMLEGGGLKHTEVIDGKEKEHFIVLANNEKIRYIKHHFGDTTDVAIMYQYKVEKQKLEAEFKNALILQGETNAEGVDLSHIKHLIIYSQSFSTAKHTQRRARQANKARSEEIKVHFLLVKKAVSEQVYKIVSVNKTNFVDSTFEREEL